MKDRERALHRQGWSDIEIDADLEKRLKIRDAFCWKDMESDGKCYHLPRALQDDIEVYMQEYGIVKKCRKSEEGKMLLLYEYLGIGERCRHDNIIQKDFIKLCRLKVDNFIASKGRLYTAKKAYVRNKEGKPEFVGKFKRTHIALDVCNRFLEEIEKILAPIDPQQRPHPNFFRIIPFISTDILPNPVCPDPSVYFNLPLEEPTIQDPHLAIQGWVGDEDFRDLQIHNFNH